MALAYDPKHLDFYGSLRATIKNPVKLMKQIGYLVLTSTERHFKEESFKGKRWVARMSKQRAPKINYAGAMRDFARGAMPLARRFKDRPALKDTGALRESFSPRSAAQSVRLWNRYTVEVGAWGPPAAYAGLHQAGGISIIAVTKKMKDAIRGFLKTGKGKKYWPKFARIVSKKHPVDSITVKVPKRQFLGMDHTLALDIKALTEEMLRK